MRILALIDDVYRRGLGGMQVVAQEIGERLVRRGHDVTFLAASSDGPETVEYHNGVCVVRYPSSRNPLGFVRAGIEAAHALRRARGFDIVHTHFAYAAVGPKAAIPPGVPRIRTYHGAWQNEAWIEDATRRDRNAVARMLRYAMRYGIERHDLRRSERIFVLSEAALAQVRQLDVEPSRVDVVPAGIDLGRFYPGDRVSSRIALGLPLHDPVLLCVGRLVRLKGVHNLINALPAIRTRHPRTMLVIAGEGPERDALERLAEERGVAAHLRFTGHLDGQLAEYYRSADLCVMPSIGEETLGLVVIEALACGTPVFGTPRGALVELLGSLDRRLIATGMSTDALTEGICGALDAVAAGLFCQNALTEFVRPYAAIDRHVSLVEQRCYELLRLRSESRRS